MGDPTPFADDEPVYVDRSNCAHALVHQDGLEQMMCMARWPGGPSWVRALGELVGARRGSGTFLLWWQTRSKAFKPWPAWPCQSCVRLAAQRRVLVLAGGGRAP